jgi:hypothetical protein
VVSSRSDLIESTTISGSLGPLGYHQTDTCISILGFLQTATSTAVVLLFFINYGKLTVKRRWKLWVESLRLRRLATAKTLVLEKPKSIVSCLLQLGPDAMQKFLEVRSSWSPFIHSLID